MKRILGVTLLGIALLLTGCETDSDDRILTNATTPDGVMLQDPDGNAFGVKYVNGGKIRVSTSPYLYDIAEGVIPGHELFYKTGYSPAATVVATTVWEKGTVYIPPAAEQGMQIVSTSAEDDVGGTGLIKVNLYYLDDTFTEHIEVITLNGTTAVLTANTDIYRVNFLSAEDAGGTNHAVGDITLSSIGAGVHYGAIQATFTRSRTLFYTVPKDKVLYITSYSFSSGYKSAGKVERMTLRATYDHLDNHVLPAGLYMPYAEIILIDGTYNKTLEGPMR